MPMGMAITKAKHHYLKGLLRFTKGNVTKAAAIAGRNRTELYRLFEKLHIHPRTFRKGRE
jgi:two-component system response regulator GlrR